MEFKAVDTGAVRAQKTLTAPKILWLKVGCPVLILRNLSSRLVTVSNTELSVHFNSLDMTAAIMREKFTCTMLIMPTIYE